MDTNEQQWVAAARTGDRTAQAQLINKYQTKVFRLAFHLLGNASDAEDVAQEALVKALAGLAGFRGDAGFGTWLYRIAYNEAISFRARRRPTEDIDDLELPAPGNPADGVLRAELGETISAAIADLSPRQRECFRLQQFEELKIEEIAAVTGLEPGSVKQHLFRAVRHLQAKLAPYLRGGEDR